MRAVMELLVEQRTDGAQTQGKNHHRTTCSKQAAKTVGTPKMANVAQAEFTILTNPRSSREGVNERNLFADGVGLARRPDDGQKLPKAFCGIFSPAENDLFENSKIAGEVLPKLSV